jgi:hypothetical protein
MGAVGRLLVLQQLHLLFMMWTQNPTQLSAEMSGPAGTLAIPTPESVLLKSDVAFADD